MKRLFAFLIPFLLVATAHADTFAWKRNTALTLRFCLNSSSSDAVVDGPTFAAGDCKFKEAGGTETNLTPSDDGECHTLALTAGQIDTAWTHVWCEDQSSGTEAWIPRDWMIYTYGDASASHDLPETNVLEIEGTDATDQLDAHGGSGGSAGGGKW